LKQLLIYTDCMSPRISYAFDVVFNAVLNCEYEVTSDVNYFTFSTSVKIAYSKNKIDCNVYINAHSLLLETDIKNNTDTIQETYLKQNCFFTTEKNSFLNYDVFATVFYFATFYQEYLPFEADKHQRFQAEYSLLYKNNLLHTPYLNHLIQDFAVALKKTFPQLELKKRIFNFLSTIDIDNAYAYANKGFKRNIGGFIIDASKLQLSKINKRLASVLNSDKDPYNTFNVINALSEKTKTTLQYFVLIGDYAKFDKNPHHTNKEFQKLLQSLSSKYTLGLHPSYESYNNIGKIEIEKKRLEKIIDKTITSARCHFLRIKFPDTYQTFINEGITDDYTMIYASQSGFRTGLCVPYKWFDLSKNEETKLTIHTSSVMEGILRDYNKLSPTQAQEIINNTIQEVITFGGEFISIWHNDSFVESQKEWIEVYKRLLNKNKLE
jgi:hypothetical protein